MAHLGNTVINGALRVLGGEYVDTINGVTVGSSPKFSDTLYNFSGVAFKSGGQNNETHDANAATSNGNYYYTSNGPATSIGASSDGALYVQSYSANWVAQMAQDYRNGNLFVRGKNNGTWQSWKQVAYKSDISTLQTNFQAGVDSVYNAIVAEGTTPASKSLSDVVAGIDTMSTNRYNKGTADGYATKRNQLTGTYTPTGSGGSRLDMGSNHNYRYVNTNTVYNTGTTNGYNTKVNQLTATYTPTGTGGSALDMGSNHNNRYVNTNTVYNTGTTNGYNAKVAQLTATYTPTGSGGSKLDMGSNHNNRYVNTNTVYNTGTTNGYNAGTTAGYNSGTTAGYNTKVGQLTATYTPTGSGGSKLDMGSNHNNRYVNTNTVYNTGTTNGYNAKVAQLTATYTPTGSGGSKLDMGSNHNYRYVNTNTVYNSGTTAGYNSGTAAGYTSGYNAGTSDGYTTGYNAGTTAGYNTKKNSLTGTYKPSSNGSRLDMGADHTYRYVNTTAVYNSGTSAGYNSGTAAGYTSGYNAGTADGYATKRNQLTGTYKPTSRSSRADMGSNHNYRYVNTTAIPNKNDAGLYGITGCYATVQWGNDGAYSGFKLNVGLTLYALGANSANSQYSYNIKSNQKIIVVVSPDLRNGTSPTASCTRAANTVTITALSTSNPGIKVWKAECLSGATYVYFTCNYPYFYAIVVIGN